MEAHGPAAMLRAMNSETFIFIALQLAAVIGTALLVLAIVALGDRDPDVDRDRR